MREILGVRWRMGEVRFWTAGMIALILAALAPAPAHF